MKSVAHRIVPVAVVAFVFCARWSLAQDPVKVAPEVYKVILDNDRVRVLDIRLKPGGETSMHEHPAHIVYTLSDLHVKFTLPDGSTKDLKRKAGEASWQEAEKHAVKNIGQKEAHVLNIEFKAPPPVAEAGRPGQPVLAAEMGGEHGRHVVVAPNEVKWGDVPASLPPGAKMAVLEGDLNKAGPFTFRLKVPAGYKVPPHWHPADEHVTVIAGSFRLGFGDKFDTSKGKEIPTGGFAAMSRGVRHYAWTTQETIIQIHGIGPWGIKYVNPQDAPWMK